MRKNERRLLNHRRRPLRQFLQARLFFQKTNSNQLLDKVEATVGLDLLRILRHHLLSSNRHQRELAVNSIQMNPVPAEPSNEMLMVVARLCKHVDNRFHLIVLNLIAGFNNDELSDLRHQLRPIRNSCRHQLRPIRNRCRHQLRPFHNRCRHQLQPNARNRCHYNQLLDVKEIIEEIVRFLKQFLDQKGLKELVANLIVLIPCHQCDRKAFKDALKSVFLRQTNN